MEPESRVLIMGAMNEEIETLVSAMVLEKHEEWNGFHLHFGSIDERKVVICKSGIGKVFASLITQHILDDYPISHALFTGVAGAISEILEPGDIVLGDRLIQHDMDALALGFQRGHIPFTDYRYFHSDPLLMEYARNSKVANTRIVAGCIGTGDQFITDKTGLKGLDLDCVDMEGCAVAQVCEINQVPSLVIRIISDKADGTADIDFAENLPRFAGYSLELIRCVLALI